MRNPFTHTEIVDELFVCLDEQANPDDPHGHHALVYPKSGPGHVDLARCGGVQIEQLGKVNLDPAGGGGGGGRDKARVGREKVKVRVCKREGV